MLENHEHANVILPYKKILTLQSQGVLQVDIGYYVEEVQMTKKFGNPCITCTLRNNVNLCPSKDTVTHG